MDIFFKPEHLIEELHRERKKTIGFVPTMGALHEGHLKLIDEASLQNDISIVSIFVNPTQFNNKEDLDKYPNQIEKDLELLKSKEIDYVFLPQFEDIYPDDYTFCVQESQFSKVLCGANRPGHFDGVLTIVLKLIQIIQPTNMYMGEKDYQQYTLVKKMQKAFFINTHIIAVPTVRNSEGLALSSRNQRLSKKGLKQAELFAQTLSSGININDIRQKLVALDIEIEYLVQHDERTYAAVIIDNVRLIDNVTAK